MDRKIYLCDNGTDTFELTPAKSNTLANRVEQETGKRLTEADIEDRLSEWIHHNSHTAGMYVMRRFGDFLVAKTSGKKNAPARAGKDCTRCGGVGVIYTHPAGSRPTGWPCPECASFERIERCRHRPRYGPGERENEICREPMNWVPPPNRKPEPELEDAPF